jgi:formate/nitrite transporter FocA (FNT family)
LFSNCIGSHSTLNCTCTWSGLLLSYDQAFKWNVFHCSEGNIVSTHKPHFMPSIPQHLCNTFIPTQIWSCN